MQEYKRHIQEYETYWFSPFSKLVPEKYWGDKQAAACFMDKYWLSEQEYNEIWQPIQRRIFLPSPTPVNVFAARFETLVLTGGCLFLKQDFEMLRDAMDAIGEASFVVIQRSQDFTAGEPMFRMKFPVKISWEELISGNYISAVLLEMNYNEYFVFGASGNWGKYAATELAAPSDILGFNAELANVFRKIIY